MVVVLPHPQQLLYGGITLIFLIFLFLISLFIYLRLKGKKQLLIIGIIGLLLLGTFSYEMLIYADYQYQLHYNILEYTVQITPYSNGTYVLYLPTSEQKELQNHIKIQSGLGTISFIETEHGTSLRIEYVSNITVYGKIETTDTIDPHLLTMKQQLENDTSEKYWIFYDALNSSNINGNFALTYYHESLSWWETQTINGILLEGWIPYPSTHEIVS